MKKIYFLSILTAGLMAFNACSDDNVLRQTDANGDEVITDLVVTADNFLPVTRTSISNDLAFTWSKNDKIGVFPAKQPGDMTPSSQVLFTASAGGAGTATFTGSGWGLLPKLKYYAYFPYTASAVDTLVKFTFKSTATQTADNATTHLGANDLMYTTATAPEAGNTAQFRFHHLSSIMKVVITVPDELASKKFTKIVIENADSIFPVIVSFNPTADVLKDSAETFIDKLTLNLGAGGAGFAPVEKKLSVWFMTGAVDLTGKTLNISVSNGGNLYLTGTFSGALQAEGKAHLYEVAVTQVPLADELFYVDLGLPSGNKWAASNLTQNGLPYPIDNTILGDYYAWGELVPYYVWASINGETLTATWRDGYSAGYTQANYNKGGTITGTYTAKGAQLQKEDDAAYATLGGNWRMPSIVDADELNENCTITTETVNGVSGVLFTSNINGNTIFFPCNGYIEDNSKVSGYVSGSKGPRFWLTDCNSSTKAYQQLINMSSNNKFDHDNEKNKWRATPIRPIYVP